MISLKSVCREVIRAWSAPGGANSTTVGGREVAVGVTVGRGVGIGVRLGEGVMAGGVVPVAAPQAERYQPRQIRRRGKIL